MRYQDFYQSALIVFVLLVLSGVGIFVYRELFPEYKIYQYTYKDLENFRSTLTAQPPAPFETGIQQILIPDPENGPEIIDRCTSCHVAVKLPHFSPTRVALDINDQQMFDSKGLPILEPNPNYIWGQLDKRVAELEKAGKSAEAANLESLKHARIGGVDVDMKRALAMHPLLDGETRPFQFHPLDEYGCTSCHSGNGRALVAKRAHGPVYDGDYERAYSLEKPQFTESDPLNDPAFARMYNDKPGHDLIFQTTPILAGPLLVSKCMQCHRSTESKIQGALGEIDTLAQKKESQIARIEKGHSRNRAALTALLTLHRSLEKKGYETTVAELSGRLGDFHLPTKEIDALAGQLAYLKQKEGLEERMALDVARITGSEESARALLAAKGEVSTLVVKALGNEKLPAGEGAVEKMERAEEPLKRVAHNRPLIHQMHTTVDRLTQNYQRGKELYISQACYACHRIAGFSRSSVGPELTKIGLSYPWYVKESIVWPQADLPSSTMPNFRLDHEELGDLMAFLMAQRGQTKAVSEIDYQMSIKQWEAGEKMPWEEPLPPTQMRDLHTGMTVFATEGCASCHKLQGFESSVGFAHDSLASKDWFWRLFPEQLSGSRLAKLVRERAEEIDEKIKPEARKPGMLEELEEKHPGLVEGFYSNFKFASRAFNHLGSPDELAAYRDRLHRVLMVYIQEYGLGRDIAPHLNWSGIYRDDAWLMGHFHNPPAYTAKSIMPVMPFDDSKFQSLNYMLRTLGKKNRNALKAIWKQQGFDPALAFELLCSSCHGEQRQGNGLISEWIYPIPKNLRNPVFLRNLTKERAIDSITHGVRGTPMPPWGEGMHGTAPVLNRSEIRQLVDWLYQGLPEQAPQETREDYQKWAYMPDEIVEEMEREGKLLPPVPPRAEEEPTSELAHYYFEMRPNPQPAPDRELYYIRKQFYTPENLREGEAYYQVHCASCHGKEGTGAGLRATSMVEAKPRMFTNLPWIQTRDDLRLMRSIKYGVPGTAMTPWGDQTTALQRMQLAMFIRELTSKSLLREELETALYKAFDVAEQTIDEGRLHEYEKLKEVEEAYNAAYNKRTELVDTPDKAAEVYKQELEWKQKLDGRRAFDDKMKKLISLVKEEREIYSALGTSLIAKEEGEKVVRLFMSLISKQPLVYFVEGGRLKLSFSKENAEIYKEFYEQILSTLEAQIEEYQEKIGLIEARPFSSARTKDLEQVMDAQGALINLKTRLFTQLANAAALRTQQLEIYNRIAS